ncbi:MAG: hypothetical protein ACP5L4_01940 [Thermoplasmata archaeon]
MEINEKIKLVCKNDGISVPEKETVITAQELVNSDFYTIFCSDTGYTPGLDCDCLTKLYTIQNSDGKYIIYTSHSKIYIDDHGKDYDLYGYSETIVFVVVYDGEKWYIENYWFP